ncbi:MAG: DMT family transporter [Succinivibrio sp.]|jgi:drug/metabolite transporter (DMT)-like permease|nr:DMT family transporter [Succinivibrio sp.]
MKNTALKGHVYAAFAVWAWGLTFISTKVLLAAGFTPIELQFDRFFIAFLALTACLGGLKLPHRLYDHLLAAGAAFFGITFYQIVENFALVYAPAANVCLISSSAPLFTGILGCMAGLVKKLDAGFILGFFVAMGGIAVLSAPELSAGNGILGEILALCDAVSWGVYALFVRKLCDGGHSALRITQWMLFYGTLLSVPAMFVSGYELKLGKMAEGLNLLNMLFLALVASVLCFFAWTRATEIIGEVRTSAWVYTQPAVTAAAGLIFIGENVTAATLLGIALVTAGLMLSEGFIRMPRFKRR